MKKSIVCLMIVMLMSGCGVSSEIDSNNISPETENIHELVDSTLTMGQYIETSVSNLETEYTTNMYTETTSAETSLSKKSKFQNAVIKELKQNAEIIGGMCVDLNFDDFPEVIFTLDSPEGNIYSIYNYQSNSLVCVGTFFDWLNLCNDDISHPELKLYKNKFSDDYFYYVEKCFGIKDVTSALHVEAIVYGVDNPFYELTIMLYKNADTSDDVRNEMKGILERTRKYIETNNDLIKTIPIEIQWTLDDLEKLYES